MLAELGTRNGVRVDVPNTPGLTQSVPDHKRTGDTNNNKGSRVHAINMLRTGTAVKVGNGEGM